jgi:uncharacterized protein YdeI (YjbR/CyaY-like superfamily)
MGKKDPRIDAYIAKSADFAKPILTHLRELVHAACPEVEETMKWSFPNFIYKGMFCSMASFKAHCAFGFWKASLIFGKGNSAAGDDKGSMGHFGRLTALSDLPKDKELLAYIKEAVRLNDAGISKARPRPKAKKELVVPNYFTLALKKNKKALAAFEDFSYSHKKEYLEWITEAKTDETRQRRIATALEWMAEGKSRNWKYINCQATLSQR